MYFGGEIDLGERGEKKLGGVKTGKKMWLGGLHEKRIFSFKTERYYIE